MDAPQDIPPEEISCITDRLGRKPTQLLAVAARDRAGNPAVITCHPLRHEGETLAPFPTMYWLIDPALCKAVADLERQGAIGELEAVIAEDDGLKESLAADHRAYAEARWALLTPDEQQRAVEAGLAGTLRDKGIGGIADFTRLKCLHLHLAHHLAVLALGRGGTTAGRLIEARVGWVE